MPGLNITMLVYILVERGKKQGFFCALGISSAIALHTMIANMGIFCFGCVSDQYTSFVKGAGATFLIYMAIVTWKSGDRDNQNYPVLKLKKKIISFRQGFFTDLLNPIICAFHIALATQIINKSTTILEFSIYTGFTVFLNFVWFLGAVHVFSQPFFYKFFLENKKTLRICSVLLFLYVGFSVVFY